LNIVSDFEFRYSNFADNIRFCYSMTPDTLRNVPLFETLDDKAAKELRDLLEAVDCRADQTLFRAGDAGNAMYLIESGRVRISVKAADGHEITVAELQEDGSD
jgi:CRP-like cAMP-binding protein